MIDIGIGLIAIAIFGVVIVLGAIADILERIESSLSNEKPGSSRGTGPSDAA